MKPLSVLLLALIPLLSVQSQARTITVGPGADSDYRVLTAALSVATDGDTIRVASGTYSTGGGEVFPLRVDKPVTLEWAAPGERPWLQGDRTHTVLLIATANVTIRGFRITDGRGSEGIYGMDGGGICVFVAEDAAGSVLITDCVIETNICPNDETYDGCGGGIYCGGTWCTCFEIGITHCLIRNNAIPGNGGGVFCGLLSKVWMEDCAIESNTADDRGGGVFVDTFALAMLRDSHVRANDSPGDSTRVGWGGKGGGGFLNGDAVCTIEGSEIVGNTARYFGGGLFTMTGLTDSPTDGECPGTAHPFFTMPVLSNVVSRTFVAHNQAGVSGGGAYVRDDAYLALSATTNFWNDARLDGGAVFVAGEGARGGTLRLLDGCLVEGNECVRRGGGVALGPRSVGQFNDTRFLGNTSGEDGGALYQDVESRATLDNCWLTYNNAARGLGGGVRLTARARADLIHCSAIGNFAPWGRSGAHLFEGAVLTVTNSILWRNAGGSVEANGGTFEIGDSLSEDVAAPLTGDPGYVGWGARSTLHVDASVPGPGTGSKTDPFRDLQLGLDAFDFRLATNSPCLGTASDGGDLGASTGRGDQAGNAVVSLDLADGTYPIRGRNVAMIRGLQGRGADRIAIQHTVFGYVEHAWVRDLSITGDDKFGGIVIRADVACERCRVHDNGALGDGGGVLITEGNGTFTDSQLDTNTSGRRGGGLFVSPGLHVELLASTVQGNRSVQHGGGVFVDTNVVAALSRSAVLDNLNNWNLTCPWAEGGGIYAANVQTLTIKAGSALDRNRSTSFGGGLRVGGKSLIESSFVRSNTAAAHGGGIHVSGALIVTNCAILTNMASRSHGGGIYVAPVADISLINSVISSNATGSEVGWRGAGGGVRCEGKARIIGTEFLDNIGGDGGAISADHQDSPYCDGCQFTQNVADGTGGAVAVWQGRPTFVECLFRENRTKGGGAVFSANDRAVFKLCSFTGNKADSYGGAVMSSQFSATTYDRCEFTNNSAGFLGISTAGDGGTAYLQWDSRCRFVDCTMVNSIASQRGGAICIESTAQPVFQGLLVDHGIAAKNGGGCAIVRPPGRLKDSSPLFEDAVFMTCTAILGGGLYAEGGTNAFTRCQFVGNRAQSSSTSADGGGGNFTLSAVGHFTDCLFSANEASDDGGGFAVAEHAAVHLTNVYLVNNRAINTGGGAYFTATGSGWLQNCTLSGNHANPVGGGGGLYQDESSSVTVDSSIVYGNSPDGVAYKGGTMVAGWSCLQAPWPGTSNLNADPRLDPSIFFLADGSPCIDAGNPSSTLNDALLPPGKGTARNDMGATGGPFNTWTPFPGELNAIALNVALALPVGATTTVEVLAQFERLQRLDVTHSSGIAFQSSDPTVLAVDSSGLVSGVGEGSATLTVSYEGRQDRKTIQVGISRCLPAPSGLIAWWPAEGDARDRLGNQNGNFVQSAHCEPGFVGKAFSFDGSDAHVATPPVTRGLAEGTIQFWCFLRAWDWAGRANGMYLWVASSGFDDMGIGTHGSNGELTFGIFDRVWNWAYSGVVPELNTWYHVAATWGPGGLRIYVNGFLEGTHPYTGRASTSANGSRIGRGSWGNSAVNGLMDEVAVFNRALAEDEIHAIYLTWSAGMCPATLSISLDQDAVRLAWPTNWAAYRPEFSRQLTRSASWSTFPGLPTVIGDQHVLVIPTTESAGFFRLEKP